MIELFRPALVSFAALTMVTGVVYPSVVTLLAKLAFADQASGSVIIRDRRAVGSTLIAQPFSDPKYFWPRPSAANYDGSASAGSNLGPSNPALADAVAGRLQTFHPPGQVNGNVPIDLVTTSASGLDPHVSVEAALLQVERVAHARSMSDTDVRRLVDMNIEGRTLGVLGEPRVNVLQLNVLLDHPIGAERNTPVRQTPRAAGTREQPRPFVAETK